MKVVEVLCAGLLVLIIDRQRKIAQKYIKKHEILLGYFLV